MVGILSVLLIGCGLVSLVCWIMVLIPLFKNEGVLMGILGIICGLYAFIWGWMKAKQHHLQTVMLVWTVAFLGSIVGQIAMAAMRG